MARQFELTHCGRRFVVQVRPIDDAWELWLCEFGRPLVMAAVVSIDDATLARRYGEPDPVVEVVGAIRQRLESGELQLA